jgi:hypothetical protein
MFREEIATESFARETLAATVGACPPPVRVEEPAMFLSAENPGVQKRGPRSLGSRGNRSRCGMM